MTLDWSVVWTHRDALVDATGTTILLAVATMAIALPCGACLAALRLYAWSPIRTIAACYVEFFRNLPLILVVYWAFYVLPILTGLGLSPFLTGLAADCYSASTASHPSGTDQHVGVVVQGYVARFRNRRDRPRLRRHAGSRPNVSRTRDALGDGRDLLAARLSAGEARRLDPTSLCGA